MTEVSLFRASFRRSPVSVWQATTADLKPIARPSEMHEPRDVLDYWSLVAIRDELGGGVQVHAPGWRVSICNTWITSPLMAVDLEQRLINTRSVHGYTLWEPDESDLRKILRDHLHYSLTTWGYGDVR